MPAPHCPVCFNDVSVPSDDPVFGAYRCLNCGCIHGHPDEDRLVFEEESPLYPEDDLEEEGEQREP